MHLAVIVLAAGKGTRMKSELPKVLHRACGRSLLEWALATAAPLAAEETVVVVGHGADDVVASLPDGAIAVVQEPQLGTGDAARVGFGACTPDADTVLVILGDMPLLRPSTLEAVIDTHNAEQAAVTILTAMFQDPTGYGRVVRQDDPVVGIVEERDADEEQRAIKEMNVSVYAFDAAVLGDVLGRLRSDNDQGEYYLTDVIETLAADGARIASVVADEAECVGVNSHADLALVAKVLRRRINDQLMQDGVAILDPDRAYIDAGVEVAPGAQILPDVYLQGDTSIEGGAVVGPSVHATDSSIASGAIVRYSVLDGASVGAEATVGPYTYLRPGTELAVDSKAGSFVEIKKSRVGPRSKVPHLSYIGDTTIGEDSNVGAATITANYDGFEKNRTEIGDRVKIGSDTILVAPVSVGDDAYTGAGSVISQDVSPGALALERSHQEEIPGYAERRKRRASGDRE
ncbi:MAG: bifunctional UDP-N-acetylglucosamine diphosphorylase/glucosamine-1-phosphate N-acetyltransferase GlmU [Acidimicrobiia bacterium]